MNSNSLRQFRLLSLSCFFVLALFKAPLQAQDQFFPVSDFWNYDGTPKVQGLLLDSINNYLLDTNIKFSHSDSCVLSEICFGIYREDTRCVEYKYTPTSLTMKSIFSEGYNTYVLDSLRRVESNDYDISTPTGFSRGSATYKYDGNNIISFRSSGSYAGGTSSGNSRKWNSYIYDDKGNLESLSQYSSSYSRPFISYDTLWTDAKYTLNDLDIRTKASVRKIRSRYEDNGFGGYDYSKDTLYEEIHYRTVYDTLLMFENWEQDLWEQKPAERFVEQIEYRLSSGNLNPISREQKAYDYSGNIILESLYYDDSEEWDFGHKSLSEYNENGQLLNKVEFNDREGRVLPMNWRKYIYDTLDNLVLINSHYYNLDEQEWKYLSHEALDYNCLGGITARTSTFYNPFEPDTYFFYKTSDCDGHAVIEEVVTMVLCEGEEFLGYTDTGLYQDLICTNDEVDTLYTISLVVEELPKDSLGLQLCEGDLYNGYSESGRYVERITESSKGCDSLFILNLEVVPSYFNSTIIELCPGQSYEGYDEDGIYTENYNSILGCDSIEQIELVYLEETDPACQPSTTTKFAELIGKLKLFPNPTTGTFRLSLGDKSNQVYKLSIYSIDRTLMQTQSCRMGEEIDIRLLSPGIYILNISSPLENYTAKLVKVD